MLLNYDRLASHYEKALGPFERRFLHRLRKELIAGLPHQTRILELGAGTGLNFRFYNPECQCVASEPSTAMLQLAALKPKPPGLKLVQSRAEELPFIDGSFDGAVATLVMCSVESPEFVFAELRRVVKPGGTISLLEHVRPDGLLGFIFDLANLITEPLLADHLNRRTVNLAREAGLRITVVRKVGFGTFNLIKCVV